MILELIKSIKLLFDASALASECGFYEQPAPEKATRPYVTWALISNVPEGKSSDGYGEAVVLQFGVWHQDERSSREVLRLHRLLRGLLDGTRLTLGGAVNISTGWLNDSGPLADPDGGRVIYSDYRFIILEV